MKHTVKTKNQNLKATLAYSVCFISGVFFLTVEKKNTFIRFHAMQSVVLFGGGLILTLLFLYIPIIGRPLRAILNSTNLILWILLMVQASRGIKYKLPYIGDLAEDLLKKIG